ncbi:MAG: PorP/SprF family type IX secretion system membrane protein [Duncaniella sp.]|nr:PorP/SprF family type IX secretion system membrane protein [Duncaniella sp.]
MKRVIFFVMALLAVGTAMAQGDALLTNAWAVPTYYNPAAVGDTDAIRLRGAMRAQWVGIDGAPLTFVGAADMPFMFLGKKWGVGAVVQSEKIGLFRNLTADLQIAYKLKALRGVWTFGLQAGLLNEQFRGSEVYIPDDDDYHQGTDDAIPMRDVGGNALDLGIGVRYARPRFSAGISLLHANNPTVTFQGENGEAIGGSGSAEGATAKKYQFSAQRMLYFDAAGNIPIKNTLFEVMPSLVVRTDFTFFDAQLTARALYNKLFSFGLGYRWDDAVSLLLGAEIKGIFIAYSYDYHLSHISRASSGSHEVVAGYRLKLDFSEKNRNRHKSIRLM